MRVLMLTPSFKPAFGGVEKHVAALTANLTRAGDEITLVTPRLDVRSPREEIGEHGRVLRVEASSNGAMRAWLARHGEVFREQDVVHAHDYTAFASWLLPNLWRCARLPRYLTFHGYEGYPLRAWDVYMRRLCHHLAHGSLAIGDFIPRWYGTRCSLVTHGALELGPAPAASAGAHDEIFYLGRLESDTGIENAIRGLGRLEAGVRPRLTVMGDGPLRASLQALAGDLGVRARFLGWLDDPWAEVPAGAPVVASGYLSVLEAWSRGHFVLVSHDNPLREDYYRLIPHAGEGLLAAADPDAFAAAVRRLAGEESLWSQMRAAAMPWARAQTWDAMADVYRKLWRMRS